MSPVELARIVVSAVRDAGAQTGQSAAQCGLALADVMRRTRGEIDPKVVSALVTMEIYDCRP